MQEDKIERALSELQLEMRGGFKRIDRRFELVDERFEQMDEKIDTIAIEQNRVIREIVEIKDDMKLFATKDDLRATIAPITDILDGHTAILKRLDQERIVTNYRLTRLERPASL